MSRRARGRGRKRGVPAGAFGAAVVALALGSCGGERAPGPWVEEVGYRWRTLHPTGVEGGGFVAHPPDQTGVTAANDLTEEAALENRTLADGSGVALADYDADGRVDLYLARIAGPNVLYRNLGGWRFEDVTASAGVGLGAHPSTSVAFADLDGDGDPDLLVGGIGVPQRLLRNEGDGRFTDVSGEAGFEVARASRSFALADVDGDGDLDLYVANNKTRVARDLFPPEEQTSDRIVVRVGGRCAVAPDMAEHWQVDCLPAGVRRIELAEEDEFYLNDGTGRFERVPFTGGRFVGEDGAPLAAAPRDWGLSARFHDLNGDGAPDLYVCNDFETPDRIWVNDGGGRFRAAPPEMIRTTSLACMALDFADVDRDGLEDLFTADMEPLGRQRRLRTIPPMQSDTTPPGGWRLRVQRARNTLQMARGDGTYYDVAPWAGVSGSEWTWASLFLDADLDGFEDLLVANGHVWDLLDADTGFRVARARGAVDWREEQRLYPPMPVRNFAFRNRGDGTFEEVGERWRFASEPDISHGMAVGDLDGDGDLDVVVTRLRAVPRLLENRAAAPRVVVRPVGRAPNTGGIGAIIRVRGGAVPVQVKEVSEASSYLSDSDGARVFAAGDATALTVEIRWPGGATSRLEGIPPDRELEVFEPEAAAGEAGRAHRETEPPLFRKIVLETGHAEPFFDELARQPLLPERLAQAGPGVSWIDLDADGDPDLVVGSGRGGRPSVFRNRSGRLEPADLALPVAPLDQTTILPLPGDGGRPRLLVGRMSYEAPTPDDARAMAAVVELSLPPDLSGTASRRDAIPGMVPSVGALALADVDADGDLDLFVGARVYPARYPLPAPSRLYRNEGTEWRADPAVAALLEHAGIVSAALFTDIDGDGDPDLALAFDWGPIRILRNDGGRFRDVTRAWGLEGNSGRWNGLASGDLDEDGRPDLIATSWGWNTGIRVDDDRPLYLYHGDLDGNGTYETIRAQQDPGVGGVAPLEDLRRLVSALPAIQRTVGSFAEYAGVTMRGLLGEGISRLEPAVVRTLSHTVFLNRPEGFEARPLPLVAQMAPGFHAGVADHDGDGHDDVFMTQNFFATVPGVARYDAGRSLWLAGDGEGDLTPVDGARSGIAIYGDPRGAALADFDGDARIDLAVSQNGAETVVYRNVGARPGLRVRLRGPATNPLAIGAALRVRYADGAGPLREIQAGSGYWSMNDATQVLGLREDPRALWVRSPDGSERVIPLESGRRDLTVDLASGPGGR